MNGTYFCISKMCMKKMGYWPTDQPRSLAINVWAIINFVILFVGILTELHAGLSALNSNIIFALDTLCPAATSTVTLLKMFLLYYYRYELNYIMHRLHDMLNNNRNYYYTKIKIRMNYTKLANLLNLVPLVMGLITCTAYTTKPIIMAIIMWLQNMEIDWILPFNMTMPMRMLRGPFYFLAYIFTAYTGYITVFMFSGCDAFYFESCCHITALLHILHIDVINLLDTNQQDTVVNQFDYIKSELRHIINKHNDIIHLLNDFRKCYTIIIMAHFLSASFVIGSCIFNLLTVPHFAKLIYVTYFIAVLFQLAIYCYGGTIIIEKSNQLSMMAFNSNWFSFDTTNLKCYLLMITLRSQRSLTMAVPFFAPSMEAFASILRASGSIMALASTFK